MPRCRSSPPGLPAPPDTRPACMPAAHSTARPTSSGRRGTPAASECSRQHTDPQCRLAVPTADDQQVSRRSLSTRSAGCPSSAGSCPPATPAAPSTGAPDTVRAGDHSGTHTAAPLSVPRPNAPLPNTCRAPNAAATTPQSLTNPARRFQRRGRHPASGSPCPLGTQPLRSSRLRTAATSTMPRPTSCGSRSCVSPPSGDPP